MREDQRRLGITTPTPMRLTSMSLWLVSYPRAVTNRWQALPLQKIFRPASSGNRHPCRRPDLRF